MNAFFGLHVLFGYHKLPDSALFWSKDETLGVSFVQKVMRRDRFDKLSQYLHLNNNEKAIPHGQRGHVKLFKIRPFLNPVIKSFCKEYRPNQNLSVDEAMVAFKGQLSMKQYIPLKPIKRGI
ncbi:piggyBac transposable element-derived protein 4-like [Montipora capricornis]|uniref:piggyBac transposable element-derived protein 4-like n=1 Tax=Montipora capricornis TaxID=246305 RepID=UPI0035F15F81